MAERGFEPPPGFFRTILDVTVHPRRTFAKPRDERTSWPPLLFALVVVAIESVVNAGWLGLVGKWVEQSNGPAGGAITRAALDIVLAIPKLYLEAAVLHGLLWLLGNRGRRFGDTLDCVCLAMAPWVLSVIPLLGSMAGMIWSWAILVVGLSTVHGLGWGRPLVALVAPVVAPILVAFGLRGYVIEAFKMPSGSMWPTLEIQDHLFITKAFYRPQYGEAIVHGHPGDPSQDFIKRVIAMSGDEIEVDGGQPIINGWRVPRCPVGSLEFRAEEGGEARSGPVYLEYLGDQRYLVFEQNRAMPGSFGPYRVQERELFVLGDNRNNSSDSRAWNGGKGGGVPLVNVKGKAWIIWMSFYARGAIATERIGHRLTGAPRLPLGAAAQAQQALQVCLAHPPAQTLPPRAQGAR